MINQSLNKVETSISFEKVKVLKNEAKKLFDEKHYEYAIAKYFHVIHNAIIGYYRS